MVVYELYTGKEAPGVCSRPFWRSRAGSAPGSKNFAVVLKQKPREACFFVKEMVISDNRPGVRRIICAVSYLFLWDMEFCCLKDLPLPVIQSRDRRVEIFMCIGAAEGRNSAVMPPGVGGMKAVDNAVNRDAFFCEYDRNGCGMWFPGGGLVCHKTGL